MSGGHFDYKQHQIEDIAGEIEHMIAINNSKELDEYGGEIGRHYHQNVIKKFKATDKALRKLAKMAHHIDWLISDDYGEDTFLREWTKDKLD